MQAVSVPEFTPESCPTVVPALRLKPSRFEFQRLQFIEAVMRKSYMVKDFFFSVFVRVVGFEAAFANHDLNYQAKIMGIIYFVSFIY